MKLLADASMRLRNVQAVQGTFSSTKKFFPCPNGTSVHLCTPCGDVKAPGVSTMKPSRARDQYLCVLYSVECGPERPKSVQLSPSTFLVRRYIPYVSMLSTCLKKHLGYGHQNSVSCSSNNDAFILELCWANHDKSNFALVFVSSCSNRSVHFVIEAL